MAEMSPTGDEPDSSFTNEKATTSSAQAQNPPPSNAARFRLASKNRPTLASPGPSSLRERRRSSVLSFSSIDEITQSFHDDILQPKISTRKRNKDEHEVSHWHSSPLAFALLPALAGILFKNGSIFVTDILLLGLAAVFMNWSIRLPWDWYYSAQSIRQDAEPLTEEPIADEVEDAAVETDTSVTSSPRLGPKTLKPSTHERAVSPEEMARREQAVKELRRQELLALLATFIFPMGSTYLLHVIRAQLSRPSTGLVSDYNLSIFLLAAEIRPFRQLVRLMSDRTLHLQRTVTGLDHPFSSSAEDKSLISNLSLRLAELEARVSDSALNSANTASQQTTGVHDLAAEIRKRYEPRLEGLERAVRRYEKRSATLAMLTEQRLQALETRVNDAVSIAAAVAQNSREKGLIAWSIEQGGNLMLMPIKVAWELASWPFLVVEEVSDRVKNLMLNPIASKKGKYSGGHRDEMTRIKGSNGSKKVGR